ASTPSVAPGNGKDIFALDNIFALIDEYICADHPVRSLFACDKAADHTFSVLNTELSDYAEKHPITPSLTSYVEL
ncbi:hypothetical protein, partial [Tunturibacter empetritectus]